MTDICTRMDALFPGKTYCTDLNLIQTCTMDSDLEKHYLEKLEKLIEDEGVTKLKLKKVQKALKRE